MLRAILLDFNGVIADDEKLHFQAFEEALAEVNIPLPFKEYMNIYIGMDDKGVFKHILKRHGKATDPKTLEKWIERKSRHYEQLISQQMKFFPGAKEFIQTCTKKYLLAIVSGALQKEVDTILLAGKLKEHFQVIVTAEDVSDGKPSPEGYQRAVQRLNEWISVNSNDSKLTPEECLAVEDTPAGIEAAHRAGIKSLALAHSFPSKKLYDVANFVAPSFADIPLKEIAETYW